MEQPRLPQENIYIADTDHNRILVFAPDGALLHTWGSQGGSVGQLQSPTRLRVDAAGNLLVVDWYSRIQKIDPQGNFSVFFQKPGLIPSDYAYDHAGNLYVTAPGAGIYAYDPALTELGHWSPHAGVPGRILIDSDDNLYVMEQGNHSYIVKYDPRILVDPPSGNYPPNIVLTALPTATGTNLCERGRLEAIEDAHISADLAQPGVGPYYFVYLLVARGEGSDLAGLQCGLSYQNGVASGQQDGQRLDIFDWHLCADLQFPTPAGTVPGTPDWPGPGSGNLITWDPQNDCQRRNTVSGK